MSTDSGSTTDALHAITLVWSPNDKHLDLDIGAIPAPLAIRFLNMAIDQLEDLTPIESITVVAGGDKWESVLIYEDEGEE